MNPQSAHHAADYLRTHDRDRYFATLVLKPQVRPAVQALYAFSADVATIRDRAREPAPGEIRLQWWADAIAGKEHGAVRGNPLADALLSAIEAYRLPAGALQRLVNARRFDLYDDPMPDVQSFEGYAGETVSVLYQFAAMILNDGREIDTGDAAGHLGVGHALVGHLRAFGFNASRGRLFLPLSVFTSNGVSETEIFSGAESPALRAAYGQLVDLAGDHLSRSAAAIARLPRHLAAAFAPHALLRQYLSRIEAQSATPFAPPSEVADWRKIATLVSWGWRHG
jgi:phytoene synthase